MNPSLLLRIAPLAFLLVAHGTVVSQVPVRALVEERRIDITTHYTGRGGHTVLFPGNGTIVFLTDAEYRGKVFSADGKLIRAFARQGSGPGEIRTNILLSAGLVGDTVWIDDSSNRRLSLYAVDGTPLRDIPYAQDATWRSRRAEYAGLGPNVGPKVLLPGGRAYGVATGVLSTVARGRGGDLPAGGRVPLLRMGWDRSISGEVMTLPLQFRWFRVEGTTRTFGQELEHRSRYAFSSDGRRLAVVSVGTGSVPAVEVLHLSIEGDTIARHGVPFKPDPITPRYIDSLLTAWVTPIPRENLPAGFPMQANLKGKEGAIREQLVIPKYHSPFRQVKLANDGTVWLQWHSPGSSRRWLIISPRGVPTMEVELPLRSELQSIDGAIWGLTWDDDDLPSLTRYRIGPG
jgi:hypothetical protein